MNRLVVVVAVAALASGHSFAQDSVVEVPSNVMKEMVLTKVDPVYPQSAIANDVGGIVALHASINKYGKITKLDVTRGPEELRSSALEAVKQWTFVPYRLNQQPRAVSTTILIYYSPSGEGFSIPRDGRTEHHVPSTPGPFIDILSEDPLGMLGMAGAAPTPGQDSGLQAPVKIPKNIKMMPDDRHAAPLRAGPVRLSSEISSAHILSNIQPKYPAIAEAARVQGTVVLQTRISESGSVEMVSLISGPPLLVGAAIDAVQQWKWKPFLLNGEPTKVDTTVIVNFNLHD